MTLNQYFSMNKALTYNSRVSITDTTGKFYGTMTMKTALKQFGNCPIDSFCKSDIYIIKEESTDASNIFN